MTLLYNAGRVFGAAKECDSVRVRDGAIAEVGRTLEPSDDEMAIDCNGCLITAGLIDSHTHPLYAGNRTLEIAERSAGATYQEIASRGGGIEATVRATRASDAETLSHDFDVRLERWLSTGTTTLEAKTGYDLTIPGELEMVRILAQGSAPDRPAVIPTYLAAHALPPDASNRANFVEAVAQSCPEAQQAGASFVDVFCDEGYFSVSETRTILQAGLDAGLGLRVHADELALTGGAQLAAEMGALSADHLLKLDDAGVAAMARAGVVATLCPATALAMGIRPPVADLVRAGVQVALGTDHNPGTSGLTDMTIVIALAVSALGMSAAAALEAATVGGARSLGLSDRGRIAPGLNADLVVWDADHEGAFAWAWGVRPRTVMRAGRIFSNH